MNAGDEAVSPAWRRARRILCVRLDNLGDVLMSTPAMRALRQAAPGRRLTLLASPSGAAAAAFVPEIDEVVTHCAPWARHDDEKDGGPQADLALVERLRAGAYDAAVVFTVYSQSALPAALLCRLAGISAVLGYSRENPYRLLSPWVREEEPQRRVRHEVQRQLDLVAHVAPPPGDARLSFRVRPADRLGLRGKLAALGLPGEGGWIVVHCGATAASRRYPAPLYARAIGLLRRHGLPILLTGSPGEAPLVRSVERSVARACGAGQGVFDLSGRLSLGELGALIEGAALLVCNNSGPAHIGAALGTPVVDLYALTNPQHAPWLTPHRLLYRDVDCKYCYRSTCPQGHHACLAGVAPEEVAEAAAELLAGRSGDASLPAMPARASGAASVVAPAIAQAAGARPAPPACAAAPAPSSFACTGSPVDVYAGN